MDNKRIIEKMKKLYNRKSLINVTYIIKKILISQGYNNIDEIIPLKHKKEVKEFNDEWWNF